MFQSLKINSLGLNKVAQIQIYVLLKYARWAFILFFFPLSLQSHPTVVEIVCNVICSVLVCAATFHL